MPKRKTVDEDNKQTTRKQPRRGAKNQKEEADLSSANKTKTTKAKKGSNVSLEVPNINFY